MKRWIVVLSAVALLSLSAGRALAGVVEAPNILTSEEVKAIGAAAIKNGNPFAMVQVGDGFVNVTDKITPIEGTKLWGLNTEFVVDGMAGVKLTATFNNDPFITFGATTTNLIAGPITYAFLFGTPIVPGLYNNATSTAGLSLTNGASGTSNVGNSVIYPSYVSGYGTVGFVPTNLGVDIGTGTVTSTGAPFTNTTTTSFGPGSNTFASTFYDNLEALLTYTQDDIGSVASWSGAITLNAVPVVPEPVSLALFGMGALALGAARIRRRRTISV